MKNIKYALVIPGRPMQFIEKFKLSIADRNWEKGLGWGGCSKDQIDELYIGVQYIESQLHPSHIDEDYLYSRWHKAMSMDSLSYNEALCVLLGIPVDLTDNFIHVDLSKEDIELELDECCAEYEFYNTDENNYLKRKYFTPYIDTKKFIEWSIEKNFIECLDDKIAKETKEYGFDKFNSYRALAEKQNTRILVKALEDYTGKQTPNALLSSEETPFYKKLINDLVKMNSDGNKKPLPKTLLNYHSKYNKTYKK